MESRKKQDNVGAKSKAKLGFEVGKLRLVWIKQLTGMFQDSLVFAAVYVVWIFPDVTSNGIVPISYLILGIFVLSIPMLFIVTLVGWYYDKKLRVWSPDMIVKVERTPYTYVPFPRDYVMDAPAQYLLLETMRDVFQALNIDATEINTILNYMNVFFDFKAAREKDMQKSRDHRRDYGKVFNRKKVDTNEN